MTGFSQSETFRLIKKTNSIPGDIDTTEVKRLNEPLKALAALYSSLGGTMCNGEYCELTSALGLGKQGSKEHKSLIEKYFPGDKVAEAVLKQDCYLRPSGASTFSDYAFLTIFGTGDKVKIFYSLGIYNRGESSFKRGKDIYKLQNGVFKKIKRKFW